LKLNIQSGSCESFVSQVYLDLQRFEQGGEFIYTAAWHSQVLGKILATTDDARLPISGQSHALRLIKIWILKSRQPDQAIPQRRCQFCFWYIDLIPNNQIKTLRQRSNHWMFLMLSGWRRSPGTVAIFISYGKPNTQKFILLLSMLGDSLYFCTGHPV